ncbi:exported hypothetical protein [Syntrophobacter sp. SbD1]|nr:exported hypothetical protein [Syntrophobacter sp. SbD1]
MKKFFPIIQLAFVAVVVFYGTFCLFRGDFVGAYSTFPLLLFYWVWFVARKRRKNLEKPDDPFSRREGDS